MNRGASVPLLRKIMVERLDPTGSEDDARVRITRPDVRRGRRNT
jgi:hypothetical protein